MYRISVQEEGRSQMSVESNMMKVDSEKIKEVLRHHNELTQQIHNQVIDIRKKIDEVEQQSLEMASYPKIDLSATGSGSGIHKDLADVYLNYGRYVIACTTLYGQVGDYIDFQRENGEIIHAVIGDIKSQSDPGCNQYGHDNGRCVVEFVVKKSTWYPSHANPGTAGCHPEWNSRVVRAVNTGYNYLQQ